MPSQKRAGRPQPRIPNHVVAKSFAVIAFVLTLKKRRGDDGLGDDRDLLTAQLMSVVRVQCKGTARAAAMLKCVADSQRLAAINFMKLAAVLYNDEAVAEIAANVQLPSPDQVDQQRWPMELQ